jgi:hypothetical protein
MVGLGDEPGARQCPQPPAVYCPKGTDGVNSTGVRLMVLSSEIPSTMVQQAYSITPEVYQTEMWKHLMAGVFIGAITIWLMVVMAFALISINNWVKS